VLALLPLAGLSAADPPAWTYRGFSASGYVDLFYNRPSGPRAQWQAFNLTANRLSLASATASIGYDAAPLGFRVDAGDGRAYDSMYDSEPRHAAWSRHLLNAYVTVKPGAWHGAQIDLGKFTTSASAEPNETHLNWNYSRSLLFLYAPYYHTGLRFSLPVGSTCVLGAQLVTGWNTVLDNNSGKTLGLTSTNTFGRFGWANVYYGGPENDHTNRGWRHFYDSALTFNPNSRVSTYFNFDAGRNGAPLGGQAAAFWGVAAAARMALSRHVALASRIEYYGDRDGYWSGTPQALKEFTITGEYKFNESLLTRLEYRTDFSNQATFDAAPGGVARNRQHLLVAGLVFVLKPGFLKF
jgi:hypothetical protein